MKSSAVLGERILLARKRKGLSLRALQDAMGGLVSAQAIGAYERGEITPGSNVLLALCRVLDVSLTYLMAPQQARLANVEFRKKASTSAKDRARVEAEVLQAVERYLQIETILGLASNVWQQPFDRVRVDSPENGEEVALRLRDEWELGLDPIRDLTELLEEKGLKILFLDLPESVSGLTCFVKREGLPDVPVIVVNRSHPLERRRHTLAHELGHRLIDGDEELVEKAVTHFAGAFLVPQEPLIQQFGKPRHSVSYQEIMVMKKFYRVSAVGLWVRLRRANIINESTYMNAFRTFARGWRKDEPDKLEDAAGQRLEQPVRFERLCLRALSEGLISLVKSTELLEMPVDKIQELWTGPKA